MGDANMKLGTCIATMNSLKPRYPCLLASAIAHTYEKKTSSISVEAINSITNLRTCFNSGRGKLDMEKNLIASPPVMRPSPSAQTEEAISCHRLNLENPTTEETIKK